MTQRRLEQLLARLYTDAAFCRAALADPRAIAVDAEERAVLLAIDRVGLELAAASYAAKRASCRSRRRWSRPR